MNAMLYENKQHVTDEERREFLKALGITGALAAGGVTLSEVRQEMSTVPTHDLAPIGKAIKADLASELNVELLASESVAFASEASTLPTVAEKGLPEKAPRNDFGAVAAVGKPVYDHLTKTGFFESTTTHLPAFTSEYLESSVRAFAGSAALSTPLAELGLTGEEGVDLLTTVVTNAERIRDYHWVATDEIPREKIEFGEFIPPMTQGAAGGALLWLADLDQHLWQTKVLLTDIIHADATWHAHSMAAGFQLMTEGAKVVAEESGKFSDSELGALLSTGFAIQVIAQNLLPQDVYWITEEMRAPRRTNLKVKGFVT